MGSIYSRLWGRLYFWTSKENGVQLLKISSSIQYESDSSVKRKQNGESLL